MAVLLIRSRFTATCGDCGRDADPGETSHEMESSPGWGCGVDYTQASALGVPESQVRRQRPDLEFIHRTDLPPSVRLAARPGTASASVRRTR